MIRVCVDDFYFPSYISCSSFRDPRTSRKCHRFTHFFCFVHAFHSLSWIVHYHPNHSSAKWLNWFRVKQRRSVSADGQNDIGSWISESDDGQIWAASGCGDRVCLFDPWNEPGPRLLPGFTLCVARILRPCKIFEDLFLCWYKGWFRFCSTKRSTSGLAVATNRRMSW